LGETGRPASLPAPSTEGSIGGKVVSLDPLIENLVTVEELAGALGIAPKTVRNWVALRQIPFLRIGGKTKFRRRSIEAWLERKEFKPCP
jgi:excisionase family DNA binding protein